MKLTYKFEEETGKLKLFGKIVNIKNFAEFDKVKQIEANDITIVEI